MTMTQNIQVNMFWEGASLNLDYNPTERDD